MSHTLPLLFIIAVVFSSFGILADATIVYGIFRFKKLKTPSNILLANWAIADLLSIIILPTNIVIYVLLFEDGAYVYTCLTIHATITFHLAVVLFGIVLCIDWCTAAYCPKLSEKFRRWYLFVVGFTWLAILLLYSLSAGLCIEMYNFYEYFNVIGFIVFYVINLLFVIALHCSRIIQKCRTNPVSYSTMLKGRLTVVTVITCSYLVGIINTVLVCFDMYDTSYNYVVTYSCAFLSAFTILTSSVVTLGVLCWTDKDFQLCIVPIGRCSHEIFENEVSENEFPNSNQNIVT